MRFGISLPIHGHFSDPPLHMHLAIAAEQAGWDGYFVWDHIAWEELGRSKPVTDPWIVLAAIAARTERIYLGPIVTPLARRRPWKVARETVALDYLSNGRLIFGAGLGARAKPEFEAFGEEGDAKIRGRKLDEALDVLTGLWGGESFSYDGEYFEIENAQFLSKPQQSPRIPIWVAGSWQDNDKRRPFKRAARYDGVAPFIHGRDATPEDFLAIRAYIRRYRADDRPFDMVCGRTFSEQGIADAKTLSPFAEAGVTWWMPGVVPSELVVDQVRVLVEKGPPSGRF